MWSEIQPTRRGDDMNPDYYCYKCGKYATKIKEIYNNVVEHREWKDDCYELIESSLSEPTDTVCAECGTSVWEHHIEKGEA
jgi:hypothetical protein